MAPAGTVPSHQHSGNESHQICFHAIQSASKQYDSCYFRHFHCSCLCQQPKRNQINPSNGRKIPAVPSSPEKAVISQGKLSSGGQECDSRFPVQTEPNSSVRMVSPPIHCPEHSEGLGVSNDGPVCNQKEQEIAPVPDDKILVEDSLSIDRKDLPAYAYLPTSS